MSPPSADHLYDWTFVPFGVSRRPPPSGRTTNDRPVDRPVYESDERDRPCTLRGRRLARGRARRQHNSSASRESKNALRNTFKKHWREEREEFLRRENARRFRAAA